MNKKTGIIKVESPAQQIQTPTSTVTDMGNNITSAQEQLANSISSLLMPIIFGSIAIYIVVKFIGIFNE